MEDEFYMKDMHERIRSIGLVPVIKIDKSEQAAPLAKALIDGGLPVAEITFRTSAGQEGIRIVRNTYPDMLVGAGTITSIESAKRAISAGAQFIVSPGYSKDLVEYCLEQDIPVYPGVSNPSQIQQAMEQGLDVLKFFPAEASGGLAMLDALSGPFPSIRFMPTGGINTENIGSYLRKPYIVACGGSWMVKSDLINQEKWNEITVLTKQAVSAVHGFTFAHIGLNEASVDDCMSVASDFSRFSQPITDGNSSCFASEYIEILKKTGRGTKGHIGFKTNDIDRALAYLSNQGFKAVPETMKRDTKGFLTLAYLDKEIGGFAIHLIRSK
jgi:2-dehydro-3-deoxyphosphogluconate aldolase/(4S)-4-hydroxy-2-oxoglutarate aldolase